MKKNHLHAAILIATSLSALGLGGCGELGDADASAQMQKKAQQNPTSKRVPAESVHATAVVDKNTQQRVIAWQIPKYHDGTLFVQENPLDRTRRADLRITTTAIDTTSISTTALTIPSAELKLPAIAASMPPTLIQIINYQFKLDTVAASQVYFKLDSQLNMLDASGKKLSFRAYYLDPQRKTLPVLKISDQATITALKQMAADVALYDVAVLSSDMNLLRRARLEIPSIRSILDLRGQKHLTANDLLSIANQTNQSLSKIVILPTQLLEREHVSHLQRLLITVWGETEGQNMQDSAKLVVTGVNGIISDHADQVNLLLSKFPQHSLFRKPLVIGHRGVPSLEDENTLQGLKRALSFGADAIENDIYITKDDHLVIMHDATVDRTTNGQGLIEDMTLAQVRQLSTKTQGYAVPTLAEFFSEMKQHKNAMHFIELKSANPKLVPALKVEISKYQVADQVVTISFYQDQIQRMKQWLPTVSTGYLSNGVPKSTGLSLHVAQILKDTQKTSSSYHPLHSNITPALLEATKHRGISIWPWTINDEERFKALYVAGVYGITTNYSQYAARYVTEISTAATAEVEAGQHLVLVANLKPRTGSNFSAAVNQYLVLSAKPNYKIHPDGSIEFNEKGTAMILPGYHYKIDARYGYTLFAAPVKVTVN
ncbi:glycerophosphoryl diester phosphodiesterase [Acinetobacter calcoaceticus]|uniref:Glycerophosphoryl diester phosphodiesterase n=1 Tax=Acinetobacter calcoaceticus TaxID=471 RepID=A0A4R1XVC9_ACICA|nr:glycerophosphoryl diester phosphodiesterase [Acinetobacter calcoaceticus]